MSCTTLLRATPRFTRQGAVSASRMLFEVAGSARRTGQGACRRPLATPLAPNGPRNPAKNGTRKARPNSPRANVARLKQSGRLTPCEYRFCRRSPWGNSGASQRCRSLVPDGYNKHHKQWPSRPGCACGLSGLHVVARAVGRKPRQGSSAAMQPGLCPSGGTPGKAGLQLATRPTYQAVKPHQRASIPLARAGQNGAPQVLSRRMFEPRDGSAWRVRRRLGRAVLPGVSSSRRVAFSLATFFWRSKRK